MWIEIIQLLGHVDKPKVTSLAEVWIEISLNGFNSIRTSSLPLRKCGLKYGRNRFVEKTTESLPLRKCGLKCRRTLRRTFRSGYVTSLAEVWIEILEGSK